MNFGDVLKLIIIIINKLIVATSTVVLHSCTLVYELNYRNKLRLQCNIIITITIHVFASMGHGTKAAKDIEPRNMRIFSNVNYK